MNYWRINKNIKMRKLEFHANTQGTKEPKSGRQVGRGNCFCQATPAGGAEERATRMKVTARTRHWRHKSKQIIYRSSKPEASSSVEKTELGGAGPGIFTRP